MKILSQSEGEQWCHGNDIALDQSRRPIQPQSTREFKIPPDAGQRVALVRQHAKIFANESEMLVWFTGWSVWPSGENMHIFDRFRLSYGESRKLIDSPCHLLSGTEEEELLSFLTIGVLFLWDVFVVTPQCAKILFLSHDEFGFRTT